MSAYSVGTDNATGGKSWWQNYKMTNSQMENRFSDIRPATAEEAALMDRIVWGIDSSREREKLLKMIV
jgi:hypothetical protein